MLKKLIFVVRVLVAREKNNCGEDYRTPPQCCIKRCASYVNTNLSDSPETPNSGQNRQFIVPCDIEIGNMTFKNNRAPLIRASLHRHMCIQSGVIVRKRLNEVLTAVTFIFDLLLPWPFAWPSLLLMAITPEKFMMMRWWKQNGVTVYGRQADGRMNGQTD